LLVSHLFSVLLFVLAEEDKRKCLEDLKLGCAQSFGAAFGFHTTDPEKQFQGRTLRVSVR
jgi:hypothetical protein